MPTLRSWEREDLSSPSKRHTAHRKTGSDGRSVRRGDRLILASQSPRRAQLLSEYGYAFDVIKPPGEEPEHLPGRPAPPQRAEALSYFKAKSVAASLESGTVLGADTVVALGGRHFGKPTDREDARAILETLSGTTHSVITGVALIDAAGGARMIRHDSTSVRMRPWSDEELERYLDGGDWSGKAGAYGIQDQGDAFVERVAGSFTNVVGLPMELLSRMLEAWRSGPPT